jgi:phage terminase large subunit-like protein
METSESSEIQYLELLQAQCRYERENRIEAYYPDTGPLRRELYEKHLQFFALGNAYRERMMMAGNRTGKTTVGSYEVVLHSTGRYDQYAPWWTGKRYDGPVSCIVAGDTNLTTRDILQAKLFGKLTRRLGDTLNESIGIGTGMMPRDAIIRWTPRRGAEDAFEQVTVRHISGGTSVIKLRSFEQGSEAFQGTEEDLIWLDENFPQSVYSESITRLMTTNGHLLMTFTPIFGISAVIREFMDKAYRA